MASRDPESEFRSLADFSLSDLEAVRLILRGNSVIDWNRLNFERREDIDEFLRVQELDLDNSTDRERAEAVRAAAIGYLRRNFDFGIPRAVADASLQQLLELASGKGHRQLCACIILKVIHIIHHLDARELLYMLPVSDQEVFHLVEHKVYRVIGGMLARGFPILEFVGGRKNKDSLYTKLLSKQETVAAQIYDKLRFRIVTRAPADILPTINYLTRFVFPFNYVIPGQSTNTMFHFKTYCSNDSHLKDLVPRMQFEAGEEDDILSEVDNRFTASSYRIVHFVVDMPVRVPESILRNAPPAVRGLGSVIFVQTEFQVIDRETEQANETGESSHSAYKDRQRYAVMRRLKMGAQPSIAPPRPPLQGFPKIHTPIPPTAPRVPPPSRIPPPPAKMNVTPTKRPTRNKRAK